MNYTKYKHVVILTGAGISAESGISTYRDSGGMWTKSEMQNLAKPATFAQSPKAVHDFYNQRRLDLKQVTPNLAHKQLHYLQKALDGSKTKLTIVTQNVDDLHERAETQNVIHIHGELNSCLCSACGARKPHFKDLSTQMICTECNTKGRLRPDIVWFGELPYQWDKVVDAVSNCDYFVSIGTSGSVHPAADLVSLANENDATTLELNLEPTSITKQFDLYDHGPATDIVPFWVDDFVHGYE